MKSKKKNTKETYQDQVSALTNQGSTSNQPSLARQWAERLMPYGIAACVLVVMAIMLYTQEWEMLYRSQELSLFLPTSQFYESMTIYPGGPLQWLACWATQFFYNPGTGVMLLTFFWAAIMGLLAYLYRLRGWRFLLTLLPVILLMTAIVQSGYWIYYTKLQGYLFVPTLGILSSLALTAVYRLVRGSESDLSGLSAARKVVALGMIVYVAWWGYINMGAWSFLALALMAIPSDLGFLRNIRQGSMGICHVVLGCLPLVAVAICLATVPQALYDNGTFCQTNVETLYVASMPSFKYSQTDNADMRFTYYLLFASLAFLAILSILFSTKRKEFFLKKTVMFIYMAIACLCFVELSRSMFEIIDIIPKFFYILSLCCFIISILFIILQPLYRNAILFSVSLTIIAIESLSLIIHHIAHVIIVYFASGVFSFAEWTYFTGLLISLALIYIMYKYNSHKKIYNFAKLILLLTLFIPTPLYLQHRWYHDEAFQNEMKMMRLIEAEDWEGVLEVAPSWEVTDTTYTPTRAMVMMKNLALFRLGRAGDEMFNYLEGAKEQRMDSLTVRLTQVGGKLLYYNYGKLNFCYRWCMEDGVEFGWKVEHLKFMARCALLKGEWKVAEKYLNLLKKTRYHREWAEKYEEYIGHPELMEQDPALKQICKLKEFGDRLDGDNTLVELYLLRTFANGHGADPVYQEQTLLSSLIMKDIDLFWPRLYEYIQMHNQEPNFHLPRHYQEAAFLYSMLEPTRPSVLWPGYTNEQALQQMVAKKVFDDSVVNSYKSFMNFNGQPHIAPLSETEKRKEFQPAFGNTFYYFYFLVRGQRTN